MESAKKLSRIDQRGHSDDKPTSGYEIWTSAKNLCFQGFRGFYLLKVRVQNFNIQLCQIVDKVNICLAY